MGRAVPSRLGRVRDGRLLALPPGLPPHPAGKAVQPVRPTAEARPRRSSAHFRTAQGPPTGLPSAAIGPASPTSSSSGASSHSRPATSSSSSGTLHGRSSPRRFSPTRASASSRYTSTCSPPIFLVVLAWAAIRRWITTPRRLSFEPDPEMGVSGHPPAHRRADAAFGPRRGHVRRLRR